MGVVIIFTKAGRTIIDFSAEVISVSRNKVDYAGGYVEGWDDNTIDVAVVDDFSVEAVGNGAEGVALKKLVRGNDKYQIGDVLPNDIIDLKDEYMQDNSEVEERAARLEQENKLLLSSMMEMSSYMAMQEQRLEGQENAIMELSTLIAMSLPGGDSNV